MGETSLPLTNGFYRKTIQTFYEKLFINQNATIEVYFKKWFSHFEFVNGELERKRKVDGKYLSQLYKIEYQSFSLPKLIFSLETYYSLWMKLYAYISLSYSTNITKHPSKNLRPIESSRDRFLQLLRDICSGSAFIKYNITNYIDDDFFNWFLIDINIDELAIIHQEFLLILERYYGTLENFNSDVLRCVFHQLFPKPVRHSIGRYHTPIWLADYILETLNYQESTPNLWDHRLLDPTCGSGTFLVAAFHKLLHAADRQGSLLDKFLLNPAQYLVGFDIDPIAVLAAKTNCILFICEMLSRGVQLPTTGVRLPVYLCDSIFPPQTPRYEMNDLFGDDRAIEIRLGESIFKLPKNLLSPVVWDQFVHGLVTKANQDIQNITWMGKFLSSLTSSHGETESFQNEVTRLFEFLKSQRRAGILPFYARLLRDAPEPIFQGKFDIVVGNPPWVNWEYMPPSYRDMVQHLWPELGLFDLTGRDLAFSKEDISTLVVYVSCDRHLFNGGRLGFLMPQSVFKSSLNSRGFRRFRLRERGGVPRSSGCG